MYYQLLAKGYTAMVLAVGISLGLSIGEGRAQTVKDSLLLDVTFPPPVVVKAGEYDRVTMAGLQNAGEPGKPVLPFKPVKLLIPYGRRVASVTVEEGQEVEVPGKYLIEPGQRPYPLSFEGVLKATPRDDAVYESSSQYPASVLTRVCEQTKRGFQILVVNLQPVRYIPAQKKVSYFKELSVTVRLEGALLKADTLAIRGVPVDVKEVRGMVDNPDAVKSYPMAVKKALDVEDTYEHVIITTEALKNASGAHTFQDLRDHRTARGMPSRIVTVEWIYDNYSGIDHQTKIRNFIIYAYQNWQTRYVLLGGVENGTNRVPARKFWVQSWSGGYTDEMPADMYYGCLDGDFNYDGDGKYGEPNDGPGGGEVDLYGEVAIGRAAVDSSAEVSNFVGKTIAYENSTDDYLHTPYMVGEHLGFGGPAEYAKPSMEEIRLGSCAHSYCTEGFASDEFFDTQTLYDADGTWSKSQLISIINSGAHILNHLGHANYTYDMKLYTSDLSSLTNNKYFFAYSQGCMPGGFDASNCFAEVITSMQHGAFAVVMNARYGWGTYNSTAGPSQYYDREFWDALFGEGIMQLGRMNADSKEDNVSRINQSCMRWCFYELNLFGDPAISIQSISSKGMVGLDKSVYPIPATVTITVLDQDLDTDPQSKDTATVSVTSDTEAQAETVTVEETGVSTKTFQGTIDAVAGGPSPDGKIQVAHGDTITVTYNDEDDGTGQPQTVTATASVDAEGPVISSVASSPSSTSCVVSWTTDEESDSTVNYGLTPELGLSASSSSVVTSHSIKLSGLEPNMLYCFDVVSTDGAGNETTDNNGSQHYQFTTLEVAPILFVDDDEGDSYETYFTQALDTGGYAYETWDVDEIGSAPTAGDLAAFDKVIWTTGYDYSAPCAGLTSTEEAAVRSYLDGGGRLFLSGQDVLYNGVSSNFKSDYLHLASYDSDDETNSATGVSGDPISGGMQLSLSYPFVNWSDSLNPDSSAAGIFLTGGSTTHDYCAVRYPTSGSSTFRIVFFAFPFEAVSFTAADPNNSKILMARIINWLDQGGPEPTITPTPTNTPTGPTPSPTITSTVTQTPTITLTPTITQTPTITNTPTITLTPTITPTVVSKLAIMKKEGVNDTNLYYYNSLEAGDYSYWDAKARNPSPYARDLWVIPVGNDAIGVAAVRGTSPDNLYVLKKEGVSDVNLYLYNSLVGGDWVYWDAKARNPSPIARDLWVISSGNDAIGMASVDITIPSDDKEELAILKKDGANDVNIYYYNALVPGDWTYWDAKARNPSPVAKDLWNIPAGNDAVGLAAIDIGSSPRKELAIIRKEGVNDLNLYFFKNLFPGDWTYWDAKARNPSALAMDLWVIPAGNGTIGLTAIDVDGGREELAVLKRENANDINIYYYRSLEIGDWSFADCIARNPSPLARDLWIIPSGNDAVGMASIRTE